MKANKNQNEQVQALASMSGMLEAAGIKIVGQPLGLIGRNHVSALARALSGIPHSQVQQMSKIARQELGMADLTPVQEMLALKAKYSHK